MIVEAIPGVVVPWGTGIGEGVPILFLQKSHIINLLMLIYLTDRQPVPECILLGVQPPRGYLAATALVLGEGGRVLL